MRKNLPLISAVFLVFSVSCAQMPPSTAAAEAPLATAATESAPAAKNPIPSPASKDVLEKIDTVFSESAYAPKLQYFADGASGPSLTWNHWKQADMDALQKLFSHYVWTKIDGTPPEVEWTEENNRPAEGGAYSIRLLGASTTITLGYGYPYLTWTSPGETAAYYATEHYSEFYTALERFCYQKDWRNVRELAWKIIDTCFSGQTLTLIQPDGETQEIDWNSISDQVKMLAESRIWVFLPEGPRELDQLDDMVVLSTGDEFERLTVYAENAYLAVPGLSYKIVDENGNPDSIYQDFCKILGI